ncbi:MAG: BlaI/MecI/CopY family transcriptional regulator [Chloroflexi bacterium]|nr:BlaI/MecI/CopY family transcriptional regulator [Chloroflexota bacterium]
MPQPAERQTGSQVEGLLGELEQAVMNAIWQRGRASVRDVQSDLAERGLAYTTIMTVMGRLADKGVLEREKQGRAFVYRPAPGGRRGFLRQQARSRIRSLLDQFGDLALAELVDELSGTPEQIAALEALLAEQPDRGSA